MRKFAALSAFPLTFKKKSQTVFRSCEKIFIRSLLIFCLVNPIISLASKSTWNGSISTSWSTAGNWTTSNGGSAPPSSTDSVVINSGTYQPVLPNASTTLGTLILQSASMPAGSPSTNLTVTNNMTINAGQSLNMSSQNLTVNGTFTISGTFTTAGGTGYNYKNVIISSGGSYITTSSNINVTGNWTNNGTFTYGTSDVYFKGTVAETLNGNFYTLHIQNGSGGSCSLGGNIAVNNDLVLSSGVLSAGSNTITIVHDMTNTGSNFNAQTSTIVFTGTGNQSIDGGSSLNNVIVNGTNNTVQPTGNITINGNLTITSGAFDENASARTITGNGSSNTLQVQASGTLIVRSTGTTPYATSFPGWETLTLDNGSTIEWGSSNAKTWDITSLKNVVVSAGTNTLSNSGATTITGNLTMSGGSLATSSGSQALTITGNFSMGSNNVTANGSTVTIGGDYSGTGTLSAGTSTFIFNGTGSQSIVKTSSVGNYNTITINKASGIATTTGDITVLSNLSVLSGTLDLGSYTMNRSSSGGTLTVSNGATLKFGSTNSIPQNYSSHALGSNSTIEYNGSSQTVSAETYGNLTLSGSGTKTAAGSITLNGDMILNSGITFSGGTYTHNIGGDWTNNGGTFTPSTSTLVFNNTASAQSINGTATSQTFNNLTISNSGQTLTLGGSTTTLTVSGNLQLTSGTLNKGTSTTLNIGGNLTLNSGTTFQKGTGTTVFTGASKTITDNTASLQDLGAVSVSGTASLSTSSKMSSLAGAGSLTLNTNTLKITGSGSVLTITTFNASSGSTTEFNCSAAYTIPALTYHHLTINSPGVTGTLNGSFASTIVNGNLYVQAGTFLRSGSSCGIFGCQVNLKGNITADAGAALGGEIAGMVFCGTSQSISIATPSSQDLGQIIAGTTATNPTITLQTDANAAWGLTVGTSSASTGTLNLNGKNLTICCGNVIVNSGGTYTHANGTLTVSGGFGPRTITESSGTKDFGSLNIASAGNTVNLASNITAQSITTSGGTFGLGTYNMTVGTPTGTGSITGTGTITASSASTVTLQGTGNLGGGSYTFYNLVCSGNGTTTTFTGDITTSGDFRTGFGTSHTTSTGSNYSLTVGGQYFLDGIVGGTNAVFNANGSAISIADRFWLYNIFSTTSRGTYNANTSTLTVSTTNLAMGTSFLVSPGTFNAGTGTVNYTSPIDLTITPVTYYNLGLLPTANNKTYTFAAGTTTINGNLTLGNGTNTGTAITAATNASIVNISGNLNIAANTTLTGNSSNALSVGGNWTNSGTFTHNNGTVNFNGSSAQSVSGSNTFKNFTINNSSGITLASNTTVSGTLTLTNGKITTGSNELNVTNTSTSAISGHSSSNYVIGNLRRSVSITGSYDFPLGTSSNYELINISLTAAVGFSNILGTFTSGNPAPSGLPSGLVSNGKTFTTMLNHGYWSLTPNSSLISGVYSVSLSGKGQTNAISTDPNDFVVLKRHDGTSNWAVAGTPNLLSQLVSGGIITTVSTGITSFSDYGEAGACSVTTSNAGADQNVCETSATLSGNTPSTGTGTWSILTGTGGTITTASSPTSTFTGTAGSTYSLAWTINNSGCTSVDTVAISLTGIPTTANAGPDQNVCGTSATLAGNTPSTGTGAWTIISGTGGTITTASSATSTFTGSAGTSYSLRWAISNSPCTVSADTVVITFKQNPTTANSGVDQNICGTSATLAGNTPTVGTGSWSIVSGTGGSIGIAPSATSTFTGNAGSTYTLRWTISNSPCTASTDDVVIIFGANPTIANAGPDQNVCGTSATLAGNTPTVGIGTWSIVSGSGGSIATASSATSTFTGTAGSTYTLRWTISNSPCTASTDDIVIIFGANPTIANAGPDQNVCGTSATLAGNTPTVGIGTWSIVSGSGGSIATASSATSTFSGIAGSSYTLRWTIANSPCSSSADDVIITFSANPTIPDAGADRSICGTLTTLAGNIILTGTGTWSIVNGTGGSINNPSSPTSAFTGVEGTAYTLRWTASNGSCNTVTDDVVITSASNPTVSNAGSDQNICGTSAILAGNTPSIGTATWSILDGTGGTIDIASNPASSFTGIAGTFYTLRWTIINNPCNASVDNVTINLNSSPSASTSTSSATCTSSNGSVSLSVNNGTSPYTYSWSNGSTSQSISGLSTGNYSVSITDVNGCSTSTSGTVSTYSATITAAVSSTDATCSASNGALSVSASGGTSPYSYSWSNGSTSTGISNLSAGNYSVSITDANGCSASSSGTVATYSAIITASVSSTDATCSASNGALSVSASGGTSPYSYSWSNGSTSSNISNLSAGNYSVSITDGNGCSASSSATVSTYSGTITPAVSSTAATCSASNGALSVSASGGTEPYSYTWSNGSTSSSISGLSAGNYSVSITDGNGCSASSSATVSTYSATITPAVSSTAATCSASNGALSVSASGGTEPYSYTWSNGSTSSSISGLSAGNYSVSITDGNDCSASSSATVSTYSATITPAVSSTAATCSASNGALSVSASGGTEPYSYTWSNGSTSSSISGLSAGNYSVSITDGNGCSASSSATVSTYSATITPAVSSTAATCSASNGALSVSASGGTEPYSYTWSNGSTSSSISGLSAGNYSVSITDGNGCSASSSATVSTYSATITPAVSSTAATCSASNGALSVSASGGTEPYSYTWSNGSTSSSISGLSAGNYSVSITDGNDCSASSSATVSTYSATITPAVSSTAATCSASNGALSVSASGGTEPYSYTWSNGSTSSSISGLSAGNYSVSITDANGCSASSSAAMSNSSTAVTASVSSTNERCNRSNGSATIVVSGGTSPYNYSWSNGATTQTLTGIPHGTYSITITDANGCSTSVSLTITNNTPTITASISTSASFVCTGSNSGSATVTTGGGASPYSYNWSNGATTQSVTGLSSGNYSVAVADANGCGTTANISFSTKSIPAIPDPISATGTTTAVCPPVNGVILQTNNDPNVTSYSWTSIYPEITFANTSTTNTQTINIGTSSTSTYVVRVTASNECGVSDYRPILFRRSVSVPSIYGSPVACVSSTKTYSCDNVGAATYRWTTTTGMLINGLSTYITADTVVTVTFSSIFSTGTLSVAGTIGCNTSAYRTFSISKTLPAISAVTGPSPVCPQTSQAYTVVTLPGATNYIWTLPANATGSSTTNLINVNFGNFVAAGSLCVYAVNSCGAYTTQACKSIAPGMPAAPAAITGPATQVCGTNTYSVAASTGTSFNWTAPSNASISSGQGTNTVTAIFSNGFTSGNISVTASNSCGSSAPKTLLISSAVTLPGTITGQSTYVCPGISKTYSVPAVSGVNFNWTAPSNASIATGQGTNSVTVNFANGFITGNLSVAATNGCSTSLARTLAISALPAAPGVISGPNSQVCGTPKTYSVTAVTGLTYSWVVPANVSITSGQGTNAVTVRFNSGFTSGTLSVAAVSPCGNGPASTLAITSVLAMPVSIIGPANNNCSTTSVFRTTKVTNAASYSWSSSIPGAIINVTPSPNDTVASITFPTFISGTVSVGAVNACGGISPLKSLTILGAPSTPGLITTIPPVININSPNVRFNCDVSTLGTCIYLWTYPTSAIYVSGQGTPNLILNWGSQNGTVTLKASNSCGYSTRSFTVTIGSGRLTGRQNENSKDNVTTAQPTQQPIEPAIEPAKDNSLNLQAYPDAEQKTVTFTFNAPEAGTYSYSLYDDSNREVLTGTVDAQEGVNMQELDMASLPANTVYRLKLDNGTNSTHINIKMK